MTGCIVCGVDDSSGSRRAASVAARLARDLDVRPLLVRVTDSGRGRVPHVCRARTMRKQLKAIATEQGFPKGTGLRLEGGDPADELISVAEHEHAGLLVVASRAELEIRAAPLGGVASTLMATAPCPVVVVPPGAIPPLDSASMRSVVCGVAGDGTDIAVLRLAQDLTRQLGGDLHAVHAYDEGALPATALGPQRRLKDLLGQSGVAARGLVRPLPAAVALQQVAYEERAGLMVVGSQTQNQSDSHSPGSVATQLAAEGNIAVVTLPQAGSEHSQFLGRPDAILETQA